MSALLADRDVIETFVNTLFAHAELDGFVHLHTFELQPNVLPVENRSFPLNGEGLGAIVGRATGAAKRAAEFERPCVFCPPVATFRSAKKATEAEIKNGLAVMVDCDEARPSKAANDLRRILGDATVIVRSGGVWADPETGTLEPRLHLYTRLSRPTRTADEHARLKRCNELAAALVGSDPSAVSLVHGLGWPGSIHRKATPKRVSIAYRSEFEIDLGEAVERLEEAARAALENATGTEADRLRAALDIRESKLGAPPPDFADPGATDADFEALADAIPNDNAAWGEWSATGLGFYAASGGAAVGFNAWCRWSRKSTKHDEDTTAARWEEFAKSPPTNTGKGALVKRAQKVDPDIRLPSWGPKRTRAEPPPD